MLASLALFAGLLLAFSNGANDNFKGVATLYGSGTTTYRRALAWATLATAAGSIASVWFARELLARFSGKGIVTDELAAQSEFGVAVALAAGITVMLASRLGFPISTTHALVGAMVGASAASQSTVNWQLLGTKVLAPLIVSPVIAIVGTALIYVSLRRIRITLGIQKETCFCVGREVVEVIPMADHSLAFARAEELTLRMGCAVTCRDQYAGEYIGVDARQSLDTLHLFSAALVSFARGLNDTPKIAALLLIVPFLNSTFAVILCGIVIGLGGVIGGKRIAETLSHRITSMNPGQGFSANLVTSTLVIGASHWGLPVSTTHVSCGALFGIGGVSGHARWRSIGQILVAWITTLPLAAAIAACSFLCIRWMLEI